MSAATPSGRILWVTEEPPDRDLGGGSIRQAHLFGAVAEAFPTELLLAGRLADDRVRAVAAGVTLVPKRPAVWPERPALRRALQLGITALSRDPTATYPAGPARRALARALARRVGAVDLVCVEHAALASLVRACGGRPATLTFHHLLSEMARQQLAHTEGARQRWYVQRDLTKALALEKRALERYQRVFTCSQEDRDQLARRAPQVAAAVRVIPNGVDLGAFSPAAVPPEPRVLFPGSLAYGPNVDGARWFCAEVWPSVRERCPEATLLLAGREPTAEVLALARAPGVAVAANVPSMVDCFLAARAVVVPLRVGTGTRLKALEAMAARRPLIGTTVGLDGIGIVDGRQALVRDDAAAIAQAVVTVLEDDELAGRLATGGRAHVEAHFGWDRIGARYVREIGELLEVPPARASASR